MSAPVRLDPYTARVRAMPEHFYMLREAAEVLGISSYRLRRMGRRDPDRLGAGRVAFVGKVMIYLYDEDDLNSIRAYFAERERINPGGPYRSGRGRQSMWTAREQKDRHRRIGERRYHRRQAARYAQDEPERAAVHAHRAARVNDALQAEFAERKARMCG